MAFQSGAFQGGAFQGAGGNAPPFSFRGPQSRVGLAYEKAADADGLPQPLAVLQAERLPSEARIGWDWSGSPAMEWAPTWTQPARPGVEPSLPWQPAEPHAAEAGAGWVFPPAKGETDWVPWATPEYTAGETGERYGDAPLKDLSRALRWGEALPHAAEWWSPIRRGSLRDGSWWIPWGEAHQVTWHRGYRIVDPRRNPYPPIPPDGGYWNDSPLWLIPLPGGNLMINDIVVTRASDGAPIGCSAVTVATDRESWCWSFSLELAGPAALALVASPDGVPTDIQLSINGYAWTAMIEEWGESIAFGANRYTASGRSRSATMAAPHFPPRAYANDLEASGAALCDTELQYTGWTIEHDASLQQLMALDWQVGIGAFSYQNAVPIEAVSQVLKAVGARLYTDRVLTKLRSAPMYPVSPWAWATATPDHTVQMNWVRNQTTRLQRRPAYNQVIVSGQGQGVSCPVRRMGSAGDLTAPMVVDALISNEAAALERGRNELSTAGRQAIVSLDLPLSGDVGLIEPGQLVAVTGAAPWRGMAVGVAVSAKFGAVTQTVEVERHFDA
jgi:hypothetical protein